MSFKKLLGNKKAFLILAVLFLNLLIISSALAAPGDYTPLVKIPGINANAGLSSYLNGVYTFLISIVGILSMAVLVYGGMRYITSAGNPASAEEAKDAINSALVGLILALVSWVIFATINKDILVIKPVGVGLPSGKHLNVGKGNVCSTNPTADGKTIPCSCIDGKNDVYAKPVVGTIATKITLTATPATVAVPGTIIISGNLSDSTGAPLVGKSFTLNMTNLSLNASRNPLSTAAFVTGAGGNFSLSAGATNCSAVESWEVVFAGDATYMPSGSGPVTVTATGGSPCSLAGYPVQPATPFFSAQSGCNAICSNKALTQDGKYHCLKLNVKRGWIGDNAGYSDEQIRAMAIFSTSQTNPFVSYDGSKIVVEAERDSVVLNTPAVYTFDSDGDMKCDASSAFPGWYKAISEYNASDGDNLACSLVNLPKGETCSIKFCVEDSQQNKADTLLYYTILSK